MSDARCDECGEWTSLPASHKCPPRWRVWCPDEGETAEDARTFYGRGADDAAEKWAEDDDSQSTEYRIVSGKREPVVCVQSVEGGDVLRFSVAGESVPSYTAREIEPLAGSAGR